nr:hypothetical protein [Tanacetum cinerariifolium]
MPTKIELTLEQLQQGVSNDVLVRIKGVKELKRNAWIKGEKNTASLHLRQKPVKMEILLEPTSNKLLVAESDSLPHAHAQTTKYEHGGQDTRSQGGDGVGLNREDICYTLMRRFVQRKLLYSDEDDKRMQKFYNWLNHANHVNEDYVFYTPPCAYITDGFKLKNINETVNCMNNDIIEKL